MLFFYQHIKIMALISYKMKKEVKKSYERVVILRKTSSSLPCSTNTDFISKLFWDMADMTLPAMGRSGFRENAGL